MTMFIYVAAFLALLAPAGAQTCDDIPPESKRIFCSEDCPCCSADAVTSVDLLAGSATAKAELLFPVKKVGAVSLFPFPAKARARGGVAAKGARKAPSAEATAKFHKVGIRSMKMLDRWKKDGSVLNVVKPTKLAKTKGEVQGIKPVGLYDVSDDDFHKTLMSTITQTHTLEEFMGEKYPEYDWDDLEALRENMGWELEEMAIHLYTTEDPNIYGPMNAMMRTATSLDDVDEYWQSYMVILKTGLETYAPFVNIDTWRGVSDCSSLDALHVGDEGVLPSFTSTSTVKEAAAGFAQGCTLLHFTGGGYDVSSYSDFPGEAELLVEEGRVYTIATAEENCDEDGQCFEQFDCLTDGPEGGVTGPTEDDSAVPVDEGGVCDLIAAQVPNFQDAFCPYCACCVAPPPPPAQDDTDCCSCCSSGGACEGDVCQWHSTSFGDVLALCNDAAAANADAFFGCAAGAEVALAANGQVAPTMVAAISFMAAGMFVVGAFVYSFHKSRACEAGDAEQPYLSLVE